MPLHLTLKKEYFDDIKSGKKKLEYRQIKRYWITRLGDIGTKANSNKSDVVEFVPKRFDSIIFKNGYKKDAPTIVVECKGITIQRNINTPLGFGDFFVIELGEIL